MAKLLMFNDGCKESQGESVKVSQNRAALFDMTFLMLVYMVQCFGSEVVLKDTQPCFFSQWAKQVDDYSLISRFSYNPPLSVWWSQER